jgi:uncharacterized protein YndB with AHSA1/START domain
LARIAPTLLVLALLAATAAAFVVTEALKLRLSPITNVRVGRVLSPVCGCTKERTDISFRLRKRSRVTVQIVSGDKVVRTLVHARIKPRGRLQLTWNGRDDSGKILPDGRYTVRVEFPKGHLRRIDMPNPLRIDTQAPRVLSVTMKPRAISPDGDGFSDRTHVTFTLSEPARGVIYVDGVQTVLGNFPRAADDLNWNGRLGGQTARGKHRITFAAIDPAGNRGKAVPVGTVVVRFVTLGRRTVHVAAGRRFQLTVSADHRALRWRLGARRGTFHGHLLRLTAPQQPGRYSLRVGYDGHVAVATVIVG